MSSDSRGTHVAGSAPQAGDAQSLRIFICYRREDTSANAGRLADALVERFGRDSVFMDVDTIEPGVDFNEEIDRAIGRCDVLIALIGPHWLDAANARGRRLDDPKDFVRVEIGHALDRDIRVIPTLVGGAQMPEPGDLPSDLTNLAKRNAIELSDKRFRSDLQALLEPLDRIAQLKRSTAAAPVSASLATQPAGQDDLAAVIMRSPTPPASPPTAVTAPPKPVQVRAELAPPAPAKRRRMLPLLAVLVGMALVAGAGAVVLNRIGASHAPSKPTNLTALPSGYAGTWKGSAHEINPAADFAIIMTLQTGPLGSKIGSVQRPSLGGYCQQDLILDKASSESITMSESGGSCSIGQGTKIAASVSGASLSWKEYQGDPSSSNPIATATLSRASTGSIPGTSNLLALPNGYVGTWRGSAHELNPSTDFAIIMTLQPGDIGTKVGTINRPSLGGYCQQDLILDKATTQSIALSESGGSCSVGQGTKVLASLTATTVGWNEYQGDPSSSNPIATATLSQATSGPIPGTPDLAALPDGYAGIWKGTAQEINPPSTFAIVMTLQAGPLGSQLGGIDRPSLGGYCQQVLILDKATSESIVLTESGGSCSVGQGTKIVISLSGASMSWSEYQGDPSSSNPIATAPLTSTK